MNTTHTIILGDSKKELSKIEKESIHLVVFSPPYWYRKDYNHEEQIGFGQSYEEYLTDLQDILKKCNKALIPGRKLCVVVGDVYLDTKSFGRFDTNHQENLMRVNFLKKRGIAIFVMPFDKTDPYQMKFARWVNRYFYKYQTWEEFNRRD